MCHGGQDDFTFETMEEAHTDMIRDPSDPGAAIGCNECHGGENWRGSCDACHQTAVDATANSLHTNLWGEKKAIEDRCGRPVEGSDFEVYFDSKCAGCHTTCGQCHVSRPNSVAGGFPKFAGIVYSGHRFNATPDMTENCTACHGSRVGTDYQGQLEGNTQDVHAAAGRRCEFCHTRQEIHGDGMGPNAGAYEHRYQVQSMPRCENCHAADLPVNTSSDCADCHGDFSNPPVVPAQQKYHAHHVEGTSDCSHCHDPVPAVALPNMQCNTCHSQPYKNCTNCHNLVGDTMATEKFDIDPSVVQFKIAQNPSPYRTEYDYVVVRHTPIDPDTYADWGLDLPHYDSKPTWAYASPHNILASTPQTTVAAGTCGTNCHDTPNTTAGLYLREIDLFETDGMTPLPDYDANIGIVMPDPGK